MRGGAQFGKAQSGGRPEGVVRCPCVKGQPWLSARDLGPVTTHGLAVFGEDVKFVGDIWCLADHVRFVGPPPSTSRSHRGSL